MRSFWEWSQFRPDYHSTPLLVGLAFLKYLSIQSAKGQRDPSNSRRNLQYVVPSDARWEQISSDLTGEALRKGIEAFESHPANQPLGNVFTSLRLPELANDPELYQRLIDLLSLESEAADTLVTIVDQLIDRGMRNAGWRGGEHYTPSDLSLLLAELLNPAPRCTIYDPACGTAGLLNAAYLVATQTDEEEGAIELFGQEINPETAALAKINTTLHTAPAASIETGNTLLDPKFVDGSEVRKFDYVVASLPIGLRLDSSTVERLQNDPFERFSRAVPHSRRAPHHQGDLFFIDHVVESLKDGGRAVIVVSPNVLAGSVGASTRQDLVNSDLIEAVINLPSNLLLNTRIPITVVVLNNAKSDDSKGKVLFVFAEEEYERGRATRYINEQQRRKIVESVLERREYTRFSVAVSLDDIRAANHSLAPGRYIDLIGRETFLGGSVRWKKLSELSEVLPGARLGGRPNAEGNTPVIQGRDLTTSGVRVDDLVKVAVKEDSRGQLYSEVNDILIQRIGIRPRAILVGSELAGVLVRDTVHVIRLREHLSHLSRYLVEFLNSDPGQVLLSLHIRGAGAPTLSLRDLRELSIPVPDDEVVQLINDVHGVEQGLIDRVSKAREIRQRLFGIDDPEQVNLQLQTLNTEARVLAESLVQVDDLDFQIRNFYPYPLAYAYRTLTAIQNPALLYQEQLRVAENVLAFLGTVGASLAAHVGAISRSRGDGLTTSDLKDFWRGGISPGDWQELGRRSAAAMRGAHDHPAIDAFASLWFQGRGTKESNFAKATKALVAFKNDHKHDRGPRTPQAFERTGRELQETIDMVLKQLSVFIQYQIRLVQDLDVDWQTSKAVLSTLLYAGDHPGLRQEQVTGPSLLSKHKLYMVLSEDLWVPLYPLMSVHDCPVCNNRETYSIDRWDGLDKLPVLKSFEQPHQFNELDARNRVGADLRHLMTAQFDPKAP
jgi:type I restriction enzyme M protein